MSDDDGDFFDTPRGKDFPPKNTSWSRGRTKSQQHKQDLRNESGSDSDRQSSSKQIVVAKIPTAKAQNNGSSSDSDYSETDEITDRKNHTSKRKEEDRSRSSQRQRYSSGSRSSSSRSTSRSRSRNSSRSSDSDYDGKNKSKGKGKNRRSDSKSNTHSKQEEDSNSGRPKTGVFRMRLRERGGEENRNPKTENKYSDDSSSASSSESESDMTDVSPLNSPHRATPKQTPKRVKIVEDHSLSERRAPKSPMHKDLVSYKNRPKSAHAGGYEHLLSGDKDSVNLKVLMHAILEMERDKEDDRVGRSPNHQHYGTSRSSAPSIADSTISRSTASTVSSRKNLSFNNSRARDIDRENQRLMNEILKFAQTKKKQVKQKKQPMAMPANRALTSAAVNRKREQERIERENRSMLRRLEGTSATKTLRRDHLDQELNTTTYVGVPLGVIHAPKNKPARPRSAHSPYSQRSLSAGGRTRSMSQMGSDTYSVMSDATTVQSGFTCGSTQSRQSTTGGAPSKPRPKSAHVVNSSGQRPRQRRPAWEEGW